MRYTLSLFALFSAGVAAAQTTAASNLNMERLDPQTHFPVAWYKGIQKTDEASPLIYTDSTVRHGGRYALCIDWRNGSEEWSSVVNVTNQKFRGHNIRLTGYLRTEDVKGWAGLWMRIDGSTNTLAFDNMNNRGVSGTTDWTQYSVELPYDEIDAELINVGALIVGKGKIWLDDLHLTIDGVDLQKTPVENRQRLKAELDTAFRHSSGISSIPLDDNRLHVLDNLGQVWGFLKYYHPAVQQGGFNMDAELFRVLPELLAAASVENANKVLEKWVDHFGVPARSRPSRSDSTKLAPDYGTLFADGNLPASLVRKLEFIRDNPYKGAVRYYIGETVGVGNPLFKNELPYAGQSFPDAGLRLLALYRYWNMIRYFYPDRHLIGEDWNKVLPDMIPAFVNAPDTVAYLMACQKLIARIHDTHANIWSGPEGLADMKGRLMLPVTARFMEEKLVVTGYYKDTLGISDKVKPGDIIEAIDGEPVQDRVKKLLPLTAASNYETQLRDLPKASGFLMRSGQEQATLRISRNGQVSEITCTRLPLTPDMYKKDWSEGQPDTGWKLLPDSIGYLYPALLKETDLADVKKAFRDTRGIIIDMRCYPSVFMPFSYGAWLKAKPGAFVRFTQCNLEQPGSMQYHLFGVNGDPKGEHYTGKLVILVNASTQSQAEYTTMALQSIPGAIVIGSTTAGADGNVSQIVLPGGIGTMISGIGILYPDGTETQRAGVKIDKILKPTIKGFREGRDELLEAAVQALRE